MHGYGNRKVGCDELASFLKSSRDGDEILKLKSAPLSAFAEAARHFCNDDSAERKQYLSLVFRVHQGYPKTKCRSKSVMGVTELANFFVVMVYPLEVSRLILRRKEFLLAPALVLQIRL